MLPISLDLLVGGREKRAITIPRLSSRLLLPVGVSVAESASGTTRGD